jgi:putative PIN family toxin of toxin-antitoxin system
VIVVLDTNVLVSALLSPFGPAARILEMLIAGEVQLALDDRILVEYRQVLARPKFGFDAEAVAELLDVLQSEAVLVLAQPRRQPLPDPTDVAFLEVAAQAEAPLITGNQRHFPPELCQPVRVISLSEFLDEWKLQQKRQP